MVAASPIRPHRCRSSSSPAYARPLRRPTPALYCPLLNRTEIEDAAFLSRLRSCSTVLPFRL
jgi:hypothetical protein